MHTPPVAALIRKHLHPRRMFSTSGQGRNICNQFELFLERLQVSLVMEPYTLERNPISSHLELSFSPDFLNAKEIQFSIDFTAKRFTSRIPKAKHELLVKAIGSSNKKCSQEYVVWDLTAGLGRDAFVMAAAGCRVHMFEKNPTMYALLYDGLQRLKRSCSISLIADRLHLHHLDSVTALQDPTALDFLAHDKMPSAIYMDPMYSSLDSVYRKSKPKKDTQILQRLTHLEYVGCSDNINTDKSNDLLLQAALGRVSSCEQWHHGCRVVVKRAKSAQPLLYTCPSAVRPEAVFRGSTQRFDVYFRN